MADLYDRTTIKILRRDRAAVTETTLQVHKLHAEAVPTGLEQTGTSPGARVLND